MAIATDPAESAKAGGLLYFADTKPDIRRQGSPGKFRYVDQDGKRVSDHDDLARIKALAIPPAWIDSHRIPALNFR
ncbi:MAG: hypothetical protein H0W86_00310 [Armatimonadetes bacterium]|nr:hypothetical protein [Armatimonadota bacterium]